MALGNNSNAIFLSIADGKIVRRVQNPTSTSVTRETKGGKTVHEEFYSYVDGIITDIKVREHQEYGKFWNITLDDNGTQYVLQMNYSSGYSAAFLKVLPNVDLDMKVKLIPKQTIEGDKKRTTLFVNQHGIAIKHFYTKDNPNGLPQLQKIKVKGKEQWDDSEMMEFLEEMVETKIKPRLSAASSAPAAVVSTTDAYEEEFNGDLPF